MKITHRLALLIGLAIATPAAATAQQNPLSNNARMMNGVLQLWLRASAEKMPEENYAFRPTPDVRTFGQLIGHVADMQYHFCSVASGEVNPKLAIEKNKSTKADLVAALNQAFAYCNRAFASLNDATAIEVIKLDGRDFPLIAVLTVNGMHASLHYGNLITYMRLKNVLPPSSDPAFFPALPKK